MTDQLTIKEYKALLRGQVLKTQAQYRKLLNESIFEKNLPLLVSFFIFHNRIDN